MKVFNLELTRNDIVFLMLVVFLIYFFVDWHDENIEKCADEGQFGVSKMIVHDNYRGENFQKYCQTGFEFRGCRNCKLKFYSEKSAEFLSLSFNKKKKLNSYLKNVNSCKADKDYAPIFFKKKWDNIQTSKIILKRYVEKYDTNAVEIKKKCYDSNSSMRIKRLREEIYIDLYQ